MGTETCPICSASVFEDLGTVKGSVIQRDFEFRRCLSCAFVFVANPSFDYDLIYSEDYYNGRGVDPKLNYVNETEDPGRSVRQHEWRGIVRRVNALTTVGRRCEWLDYGCGTGGLVNFLRAGGVDAVGFEQGWCAERLHDTATPLIEEKQFSENSGRFDVITAIEVIEHTEDPVAVLKNIRSLLKPGGLLFMTTGNAEAFRKNILKWRYVAPEVHISYFEPKTLAHALEKAGFETAFPGYGPGWQDIIRYKLLMVLGRKWRSPLESAVPWRILSRLIDARLRLSAQPIGWAGRSLP